MCSFDVCSLYTNVPLEETIEICCDVLFRSPLLKPTFPESVFKHLINFAPSSVELSFINIIDIIDDVAMGSSLGPTLANIFVVFCEVNLFYKIDFPPCIIALLTTLSVYLKVGGCRFISHTIGFHAFLLGVQRGGGQSSTCFFRCVCA